MQNIILATDSACDVPASVLKEHQIHVLPFHITFGDTEYEDGISITRDMLYKLTEETGQMPKTAALSPGVFTDFFHALLKKGDAVIFLSLGAQFSSSYQNACLAAGEFENVYVVDTASLSSGEGLVLLEAIRLRNEGTGAAEMHASLSDFTARCDASFILDRLDFMHKGGRCSGITALGANLLGIKPCLSVREGKLGVEKKYRGKLKMVIGKYIEERLSDLDTEDEHVFLTDAGIDPEIRAYALEKLKATGKFKTIYQTDAGCVISSHCGPGTLGILFVRK